MSGRLNDYAKIRNIIYGNDVSDETTPEISEEDISPPETPTAELDTGPEVVTDKAMHYGPSMYVKLFEGLLQEVSFASYPNAYIHSYQKCSRPSYWVNHIYSMRKSAGLGQHMLG
jgi:hypothetical protein